MAFVEKTTLGLSCISQFNGFFNEHYRRIITANNE